MKREVNPLEGDRGGLLPDDFHDAIHVEVDGFLLELFSDLSHHVEEFWDLGEGVKRDDVFVIDVFIKFVSLFPVSRGSCFFNRQAAEPVYYVFSEVVDLLIRERLAVVVEAR